MKKNFKKLSALLLTLVFSMSTMATVFAAEPYIRYNGDEGTLIFETNEESTSYYTNTDLFEKFKQVMPGDVIEETIVIKNSFTGCDYIKLYMGGMLHDESGNQISPEVLDALTVDERRNTMTELEYMHDFLEQLTLTVKKGDKVIYSGSPNSLEEGFEGGKMTLLGTLTTGKSVTLNVELLVPFEMGDEYANRIGEVDWIFVVEEYNNGGGGGGGNNDPDDPNKPSPPDDPSTPPEEEEGIVLGDEDIKDPEEPPLVLGDEDIIEITDAPKTGDDTVILPYIGLFAVGLIGTILTAVKKRKAKEE